VPESWEVASEEEWEQLQRGILKMFATGPRIVQEALGKVLNAKPPPPRFPTIEIAAAREPEPEIAPGLPAPSWGPTGYERQLREQKKAEEIAAGYEYPGITGLLFEPAIPKGVPLPEPIRRQTSPLGLGLLGKWPLPMAAMMGGEIVGGEIAAKVAGEEARPWGELGGGVAGLAAPSALPALGRVGAAGMRQAIPAARRAWPTIERAAVEEIGGPKPKPPPKEPTFREALGALRQERAEDKLVPFIRRVKEILPKRAAALHEHRQRQAAQLKEIWNRVKSGEITPEEATEMHFGSLRGEVEFPELRELGEMLTPQDMHALRLTIVQRADNAGLGFFQIGNAQQALDKLRTTGQLAEHEITLLSKIFPEEIGGALAELTPKEARLLGDLWELLGIPRSVQAAFDVSFPLRQGIMIAPRHPQIWGRGSWAGVRSFFSEKFARIENVAMLKEQADGILPKTLDIVEFGAAGPFAARPEPFMSRFVRYIPGIKHSEQAFAVTGNRMRRDLSLNYIKRWTKNVGRELTEAETDELGRVVNYLTGRGPVPRQLAYVLTQVLYSPRFLTSKPAFLVKMVDPRTPNHLRKMMAEELVAFVGTGIGILSLLKLSGAADVEINPLSSDFGKIKVGKMRFDIWGGGQQLVRYTAQLITGQRKTLGTGELMDAERKWIAARFMMSKLSPQAGIPLDIWRGESYMGEEIEPEPGAIKTQIWNRMGPLAIQDIVEAVREEGLKGLAALPALGGVGVLTFETPGEKIARLAKERHGVDWAKAGKTERLRLEEDPEIAAARQEQLEAAAKWGASASLELRQEHTEFEKNFAEYLTRPDMTLGEASGQYRDYVQKQAAKNEERWKDAPEQDPRSELDRKVDEFHAEEYPSWGTEAERDAWYQNRAAMRAADPDLDAALLDLAILRFKDPTVRDFVRRYEEAEALRHQYYQIPRFSALSLEDGNRVGDILREAQSLVELGKVGSLRAALYMIIERDGVADELAYVALYPQRFQNPERRQFRHEHADELAVFEPLPVDFLEGLEVD